jgi:hypothetical protein
MTRETYWVKHENDVWLVIQNGLRLTTEFATREEAEQYIRELKDYDREHDYA